ncbi:MAG: thioredoxin-disulfide reductase [Muribaculaceae bacterium]|nr:thioredoxin-disulfide reductase [Muribaculaceae bacterium]
MSEFKTKCLIIGSGPAGYTAGIYTSRAGLEPIMVEGSQPGGQLITTTEIENFPGYIEGVAGPRLMEDLRAQATRYGLNIISGEVTDIDVSKRPFAVTVNGSDTTIVADTVIICTGAKARYLGLPEEEKYLGMGVSACATCDGFFFRNRPVAVVGGGDTACEEALYLANLCSKVYMIVRKDYLRASKVMQKRVMENEKISVLFNTNTKSLYGKDVLEGAKVATKTPSGIDDIQDIAIDGFFLAIGHAPATEVFAGKIELDEAGYIKVQGNSTATNVEGIFAAGDVADPVYQQAISAAGMGCRAALDAEHFVMLHTDA